MKKQIIALILLLSIAYPINAQQHYIGLKDAFSMTGVSSKNIKTSTISSAFNPGVVYRYEHKQFKKFKFGFQAEFNLINKGFLIDADTAKMTNEIQHTIQSIEVPFMAQGIFSIGPIRPYVTAGVNVGYILDRKVEEEGVKQNFDFTDIHRRTEYGIGGGAGIGLELKKLIIAAEWRYNYNFSFLERPIIPGKAGSNYMNTTQMMISFSVLYRLSKQQTAK